MPAGVTKAGITTTSTPGRHLMQQQQQQWQDSADGLTLPGIY
jgi:hypothetical protein